jgi:hypothetical protein
MSDLPPRRLSLLDDATSHAFGPSDEPPRNDVVTPLSRPARGPASRHLLHLNPELSPTNGRSPRAPPAPSAIVYGGSRPLVNLVLYALGSNANPRLLWLDVRPKSEPRSQWDPVRMGWLDERRVWSAEPDRALAPDAASERVAIFDVVRADEPPAMLARLAEFLRLPPTIQEILAEMPPSGHTNVLAVANVDRISGSFPAQTLAPILSAFAWARCSLYVGFAGTTPPAVAPFSHVVRVEGSSPANWRDGQVHFEKGQFTDGPAAGTSLAIGQLPYLERVFRQASP